MSNKAGKILAVDPSYAIPGGEIIIDCEEIEFEDYSSFECFIGDTPARVVSASSTRVVVVVPNEIKMLEAGVFFKNAGATSNTINLLVAKEMVSEVHMVANPAVDPKNHSIILTRSGSRGHQFPVTLLRLETNGIVTELPAKVLNPTGVAFDNHGRLVVTNRADGEVYQINHGEEVVPIAADLGVATGLAFDATGAMYVGDRGGTVFRVSSLGATETWALVEPSVSAYHLAFGPDAKLYVTAPGLSSFDSVYRIDEQGFDEVFFRGLGRPQGLAFDRNGNLYVAACLEGRHGIVRISGEGETADLFVAGMNIVGLCFTRQGEMIVATSESVYSLSIDTYGTLLS